MNCPAPGVYAGMSESEYHSAQALSASGMKSLAISPLHFYHRHIARSSNEDTAAMRLGRLVHCRLLEAHRFSGVYAPAFTPGEEAVLDTMDDMRKWLADRGLSCSARRKSELIERIVMIDPGVKILELQEKKHQEAHAGKELLSRGDLDMVEGIAAAVAADPAATSLLQGGVAELSFFIREPATGVMLKARMDLVRPDTIVDIKTFSNSLGKPIDQAVATAIYYQHYNRQAVFYRMIRRLAQQQYTRSEIGLHGENVELWRSCFLGDEEHLPSIMNSPVLFPFTFLFIESAPPFSLRIIRLRPIGLGGVENLYWSDATRQISEAIELYADCLRTFGESPWRSLQEPHTLEDTDLPGMIYS